MTNYTRPKGVIGGSCLHCQASKPEHVGLTCDQVRENRQASVRQMFKAVRAQESARNSAPRKLVELRHAVYRVYKDDSRFYLEDPSGRSTMCLEFKHDGRNAEALAQKLFDALPDFPQ